MKNRITTFFPSLPLFITILSLSIAQVATAQIPSNGLVGYWPFNGNANDESGNGNNGLIYANLTTDRFGNLNSAYNFSSGSKIEVPMTQQLFDLPIRSFSCWYRLTANQTGGRIYETTFQNSGIAFYAGATFDTWYGFAQHCCNIVGMNGGPLGVWHHLVVNSNDNTGFTQVYLDGIQISTSNGYPAGNGCFSNTAWQWQGTFMRIGQGASGEAYFGDIDDVSIYNRNLTESEIAQIYTSQTSTVQAPCPTLATNLQTGLVGYWPFCGNANDESGNGNDGTVNGATLTADRFGNANSAYSFDGVNDCIDIGNSSSLDFGSSQILTVNYWVQASNGTDYRTVISKYYQGVASNSSYGLNYGGDNIGVYGDGTISWMVINSPTGTNWNEITIVMNKSTSTAVIYKNGVFVSSGNVNYNSGISSVITSIGRMYAGPPGSANSNHFNGKIDDICIWNRALTPTEITQLYTDPSVTPPVACVPFLGEDQTVCAGTSVMLSASGSSLACPALPSNLQTGLVGYWPFCGNANDASGNGNNGTVNGATLTTDRFGNANSAYSFDGNDWIEIPNSNSIQNIQSLTISGWIKVNDWFISNGDPYFPILCKSNTESAQGKYTFVLSPNSAGVHLNAVQGTFPLSSTFQTNQWRFLSISINSVSSSFYLDGLLIQTINSGVNPNPVIENTSILIGKEMPGLIEYCIGNIDDLTIHNRILSASEIQQLYTLGQSTYLWSTGATTASVSVTPTQTTTYTCTVTDANGNACTDSVTVFVPQIEATDLTICAGETTTLSVSGINSTATPTACPTLPSNLQNGLVGYWPFCGNANDESGNGNNGTLNGATLTTDRFGNLNSAYSFDGQGSNIQASSNQFSTNERTIAFWFYGNDIGQGPSGRALMGYGGNGCGTSSLVIIDNAAIGGNNYEFSGHCQNQSVEYGYGPIHPNGEWKHWVITVDNTVGTKFYLNGSLVYTSPIVVNQTYTAGKRIFFGTAVDFSGMSPYWDSNAMPFNGKMDDISIYNRPLSALEIQQLYSINSSSVLWSTGATTSTINVSPTTTTTYTCTVTTNGVSCTDSVTVVVNNPTLNLGSDVTACGTSTTLTAPTGYDSYAWSNGGTTNTTTVIANGTYTCTVTQGGCSASDSVDVTLIDATISATDSIICAGETITLSVPQGGSSTTACAALPANLQTGLVGYWPFCGDANDASGNGNNGTVNGATLTTDRFGNANSAYAFNVNSLSNIGISNLNGLNDWSIAFWCNPSSSNTSFLSYPIGINCQLYWKGIGLSGNNPPCGIPSQNLFLFDGSQGCSNWFSANTVFNYNNFNQFVITKSGLEYRIYQNGTLLNSSSSLEAISIQSLTLGRRCNDPSTNTFDGTIDDVILHNRALTINEIQQLYTLGQTTYLWSNGATTPTINVSPNTTTTYICTVTTNGVSCTDSVTVVVGNPVASITPNGIVEICQGESISLAGNGGVSYLWNTGAPTQSITVNTEAVYTVTVTDANGCTDTESQFVKVNQLPIIGSNNASICAGQSATLTATGGVSYVWSPATGLSATTGSTVTASPSTSTVYTVTGTGANGCTNTATAAVTVNALPTATITPATATTFCQGGSVVLNANTGTGLSYQWYNNASAISGATSSSYTANASGSYTVVVTNTSTCSSTSTAVVVTVNALPTATITPATATTFCQGGSVVLNANTGTGLSYQWYNNASAISGAISASYTANASGSYTVTVTNASTCSSTSTAVVVTVNALPTATITPASATTFCQGGSVVLNANTGTGLTYQWFNNSSAISGATAASYTATMSGSYTVVVTNASACSSTSTAVVVTVNALPIATITPATATTFCQGASVVLNANTGTGLTYQWFNNASAISGATSASYTATASGSYTVVVTNASTCSSTSTAVAVTVNANVDYFADADGDGFGDAGTLVSTCIQPQGYVTDNTDCDDNDATVNTAATEVCNHIDDDCNSLIDDGITFNTYYADNDGDTFGDANNSIDECSQPAGYVTNNTDCDDNNPNQNAASPEICNDEDDDCDGAIDNGLVFLDYYADLDSDGFGAGAPTNSCVDLGAGYVLDNTDCDDTNANQNAASPEICNGEDDDCDGAIDNGLVFLDYYADLDSDGFGAGAPTNSCVDLGAGYVLDNTDCHDTNANVNTAVEEICNDIDDNCNNEIDEGLLVVYYLDNDGDSFGSVAVSILACTQPAGYTTDFTDCNDNDANINPSAEDIAGNGIDENCDGQIDNSIFELNASINLYPNPTRSELNIQISNALVGNDMYIFDAVGKLVYKQQLLSTQTTLSISEYADGNYIFRVGEVVKRFEVMK